MAGAYGVASHVLQHFQLVAQGADIDGGAQKTEVVVVADTLELTHFSVEHESLVGHKLQAAYAEAGGVGVLQASGSIDACDGTVECRGFRTP